MANNEVEWPNAQARHRSVTLKDVAERAGVAPITVSRALNQPDSVSAKLHLRVQRAVRELGYVPNRMAGALASAQTAVIPVLVPSLSNVVFIEVIQGIQEVLEAAGYQLLLGNTEYDLQREESLVTTLLGWHPPGAIVAGLKHTRHTRSLLEQWGRPLVEVMEHGKRCIDMNVGLSHYRAGATMAQHLLERGYCRIGFVGTRMRRDYRASHRLQGYRRVLRKNGLPLHYLFAYEEPSTPALGGRALLDALACCPELDAIFFANDDLAIGAILQAQRDGISIPKQIAVAGFNGLSIGNLVTPRLTTIVSPRYRMGRLAAELLLQRLQGANRTSSHLDVGFELEIREST